MTDTPLRKFVKPAHPGAHIPDLDHNTDLPQGGAEVVWDHYWISREVSGDIVVVVVQPEMVADQGADETPAA